MVSFVFPGENSGSSVDWVYDTIGTKYTFGAEFRDDGTHGFLLPPDQIIPNSEENWPFLLQIIEEFMNDDNNSSALRFSSSLTQAVFVALLSMVIAFRK